MPDIINLPAEAISAINVPVLGIAGEHDPEKGNLEKLMGALPDYRMKTLAGRDHMSAMFDPQFNSSIVEFLTATWNASTG
jgi:pimeloyl-ACP methyl ester carboxylesterase